MCSWNTETGLLVADFDIDNCAEEDVLSMSGKVACFLFYARQHLELLDYLQVEEKKQ